MKDAIKELTWNHESPKNQLTIKIQSEIYTCVNGWEGFPFKTPKVQKNTKFRFASLSKAVSSVAFAFPYINKNIDWLQTRITISKDEYQVGILNLINHTSGFDRIKTPDPMLIDNKEPWCPFNVEVNISNIKLDFPPETKSVYSNLGFCLAEYFFEKNFQHSIWKLLEEDFKIHEFNINYLDQEDSSVEYNFMRQEYYGKDFLKHFNKRAIRSSMGLVGNSEGLTKFLAKNINYIAYLRSLNPANKNGVQYHGFLKKEQYFSKKLFTQSGYLYGMRALLIVSENNDILVWLGSGEGSGKEKQEKLLKDGLLSIFTNN